MLSHMTTLIGTGHTTEVGTWHGSPHHHGLIRHPGRCSGEIQFDRQTATDATPHRIQRRCRSTFDATIGYGGTAQSFSDTAATAMQLFNSCAAQENGGSMDHAAMLIALETMANHKI